MTKATLKRPRELLAASAVAAFALVAPAHAEGEEQPVRGWLEHAHIEPSGISLDAKLDTGARTSSIHAEILRGPEEEDEEEVEVEIEAQPEELAEEPPDDASRELATATAASQTPAAVPIPSLRSRVEVTEDESDLEFEEIEVEDGDEGDDTIVFRITNEQGESSTLQRRVLRYVEIKNRDGTTERRPVVEITACLAGVWVTGEVNLADREDFNYPFLVGRNMLEDAGVVVDAREIYTRSARCADPAP